MWPPENTTDHELLVDVLDCQGDILQSWPVDRKAFEYLRSKLGFVVER